MNDGCGHRAALRRPADGPPRVGEGKIVRPPPESARERLYAPIVTSIVVMSVMSLSFPVSSSSKQQCAAVSTVSGAIKDAPH